MESWALTSLTGCDQKWAAGTGPIGDSLVRWAVRMGIANRSHRHSPGASSVGGNFLVCKVEASSPPLISIFTRMRQVERLLQPSASYPASLSGSGEERSASSAFGGKLCSRPSFYSRSQGQIHVSRSVMDLLGRFSELPAGSRGFLDGAQRSWSRAEHPHIRQTWPTHQSQNEFLQIVEDSVHGRHEHQRQ